MFVVKVIQSQAETLLFLVRCGGEDERIILKSGAGRRMKIKAELKN